MKALLCKAARCNPVMVEKYVYLPGDLADNGVMLDVGRERQCLAVWSLGVREDKDFMLSRG
jgi:hypothetical protein